MSGLVEWVQHSGLGLYSATFVICFLSGLIPFINAEVYLVAAVALARTNNVAMGAELGLALVLAAIGAVGQMVAKVLLFLASRGVIRLPFRRSEAKLAKARAKVAEWRRRPYAVLFVSAAVGLPPFYLVSLAAGALGIRMVPFCAIGVTGRFLRFAIVAALPALSRLF